MREVTIIGVDITDVWINAYYTSFPCHLCSSHADAKEKLEVFHLTPPQAQQCLSMNLAYEKCRRLEIINCRAHCHGVSMHARQQKHERSLMRFAGLRCEVWCFLPRDYLDTCLLVNHLWRVEVETESKKLALRKLTIVGFTYNPHTLALRFRVVSDEAEWSPRRLFKLPRNAAVDSAIVVKYLRNCVAPPDGLEFESINLSLVGRNLKLDDCVGQWISTVLSKVENFCFPKLKLMFEFVSAAGAIKFMRLTQHDLHSSTNYNALREVSLKLDYEKFVGLVEEHFLQWSYMQNLEDICLDISLPGPDSPGDPIWVPGLFNLPSCKTILIMYTQAWRVNAPDCSENVVAVLRETFKQFEDAVDVSGFPENFEYVLDQEKNLTWEHQEPTPTYSNVPVPHLGGLWNIYVTKNEATDVPLSVFVSTKPHPEADVREYAYKRRFIFRKEPYNPEPLKASGNRKRFLQ